MQDFIDELEILQLNPHFYKIQSIVEVSEKDETTLNNENSQTPKILKELKNNS
jgi:hypothetical protein